MNAAKVTINEKDLSYSIATLLKGVICVQGITKRGPINGADILVRTWTQFKELYGGLMQTSDFPLHCKIMLDGGCQLRVNRVVDYTDITDSDTLTAEKAVINSHKLITFSAALVASNVINGTVGGQAVTATYTTNNDDTLSLLATNIQALTTVDSATVITDVGGNRQILVVPSKTAPNPFVVENFIVTSGATQPTIVVTPTIGIVDSLGRTLFNLPIKYHGADYNNISVTISTASNNNSNYFNLNIAHFIETEYNETYANLIIPGKPTIETSSFLSDVVDAAKFVEVNYIDLSGLQGVNLRPVNATYYYGAGSDGTTAGVMDYSGDSSTGTGWHAFDAVEDSLTMAAPELSDVLLHQSGGEYAMARKDLHYYGHLSNSLKTSTNLIAARVSTNLDTSYAALYAGGLIILDPITSQRKEISELSKVIVNMTVSDATFGEWYSYAGLTRGVISGVLGVVNNFGGVGKSIYLDALANSQINMVIQKNNQTVIWGNFTTQVATSKFSQVSVRRFVTKLKKELKPVLETYLEEPNEPTTWRGMYRAVAVLLDGYKSVEKRALADYSWQGDQDVNSIEAVEVNKLDDINQGKYKARLFLDVINAIREIELGIIMTSSGGLDITEQ